MKLLSIFMIACVVLLSGCGHSVVTVDKGIGIDLKIPLPNGGSLINLRMGYIDSTTTVLRGNTSVQASNASGGNALSLGAGTTQTVLVTSGPQLNEGYVAQILTNQNTDPKTKQAIAEYLLKTKHPVIKPTALTVSNGGVATGQNPPKPKDVKTGFDNVVDKISDGYNQTIISTQEATENVTNSIMQYIYYIIIGVALLITIIIILVIVLIKKKKKI